MRILLKMVNSSPKDWDAFFDLSSVKEFSEGVKVKDLSNATRKWNNLVHGARTYAKSMTMRPVVFFFLMKVLRKFSRFLGFVEIGFSSFLGFVEIGSGF